MNEREKTSDGIQQFLIGGILRGDYPVGARLPAEREMALRFGAGRPAVREAMQRLERNGWLRIRTGHPAVVNDFWREGNLGVLADLVNQNAELLPEFIVYMLELRIALVPVYVRDAVRHRAEEVVQLMNEAPDSDAPAAAFASFDWHIQRSLAGMSHNPVYRMILNSFERCYLSLAESYFVSPMHRSVSHTYYRALRDAAAAGDADQAQALTQQVMETSLRLYQYREV